MTDPPVLRGVFHLWSIPFAAAAAITLIALADGPAGTAAAAIYGTGLVALFAGSGTYHRWRWDPRWRPLLRRIDHSTIFVFIAASYTPVGVLVLDGTLQVTVLTVVWLGAVAGVAFSLAWIDAPRWLHATLYCALGWVAVVATPQILSRVGVTPFVLIAVGGLLYTAGAVVYARQRPDPWPRTFGFHEVFHAFVIGAAACHFVAICFVVL